MVLVCIPMMIRPLTIEKFCCFRSFSLSITRQSDPKIRHLVEPANHELQIAPGIMDKKAFYV